MENDISSWLWPAVSFVLAILLLWSLRRRSRPAPQPQLSQLVEMEDALKKVYKLQQDGAAIQAESLARAMGLSVEMAGGLLHTLAASTWAAGDASTGIRLTPQGRERAQELIRVHRLWERYLVDREGMPLAAIHAEAHRREHETSAEQAAKLDAELGHPAWDPHGDIIPEAGYPVPPTAGAPLNAYEPGSRLHILQMDDDSPALLSQLVALGLIPGAEVEVVEPRAGHLVVKVNGDLFPLAAIAAEGVHAIPLTVLPIPLGELPAGSRARVAEVQGGGKQQRRMLDMGLVPGAEVTVIRAAPLGDPIEYRVKGTAIAMRRADANTILVEETQTSEISRNLEGLGRGQNG